MRHLAVRNERRLCGEADAVDAGGVAVGRRAVVVKDAHAHGERARIMLIGYQSNLV